MKNMDIDVFNQPLFRSRSRSESQSIFCQSQERFSSTIQFELKDSYREIKEMKIMILDKGVR